VRVKWTRLLLILVACCGAFTVLAAQQPQPKRVVIAVSTLFDGKGKVIKDTRIVVEGSKIVRVDPNAGPVDYDLRGLTVMPGWIDGHVHITWSFDKNGKNAGAGDTSQHATLQAAANATRSEPRPHARRTSKRIMATSTERPVPRAREILTAPGGPTW